MVGGIKSEIGRWYSVDEVPKIRIGRKAERRLALTDLQGASGGSFLLPCMTTQTSRANIEKVIPTDIYLYGGVLRIPPDARNGFAIESM